MIWNDQCQTAFNAGFLKRLRHALCGRTAFRVWINTDYRSYNPKEPQWRTLGVCDVFATGPTDAVLITLRANPCSRFREVQRPRAFVSIHEAVAYPCRLARRVLFDFSGRNELEKLGGVLYLAQVRQNMVREPDALDFPWLMPDHANLAADDAAPLKAGAEHGLGESDVLKVGNVVGHPAATPTTAESFQSMAPNPATSFVTGNPHGNIDAFGIRDPERGEAVVAVHEQQAAGIVPCGEEAGKPSLAADERKMFRNTLEAAANMTPEERLAATVEVHRYFHDPINGQRMNRAQRLLAENATLPDGICPLCQRHIDEVAGPLVGCESVMRRSEGPAVEVDEFGNPTIEDLPRHEREHPAGSGKVIHEADTITTAEFFPTPTQQS